MSKRLKNYYLLSNGKLKKKENTVYFETSDGETPIPIKKVHSIYAFGQVSISSQTINFFAKESKPIHFFSYYGKYNGSYYPPEKIVSGNLVVKQSEHYLDNVKRLTLAKLFILGGSKNMGKVLSYYKIDNKINDLSLKIHNVKSIPELMSVEGSIRQEYYSKFDCILPSKFEFVKRMMNPPGNMVNAMMSFGNALIYSNILTEIYHTQLNPTISYLHEPSSGRFSLTYDISEIFKPIFVDRLIFYLTKRKMMKTKQFNIDKDKTFLNKKGKEIFIDEFNKKLEKTIKVNNKKVSYRRLFRLEAYKLKNHILEDKIYEPFEMKW